MAEPHIPVPDSSAHSGQEVPTGEVLPPTPEVGLPVIATIERGLAKSPVAMDELSSALISAVTRELGGEIERLRRENARLQEGLSAQRDELEIARRGNAVLTERLNSDRGNRHLRNVGVALGTAMASAGALSDLTASPGEIPILLVVGGIVLATVSWLSPRLGGRAGRKGDAS